MVALLHPPQRHRRPDGRPSALRLVTDTTDRTDGGANTGGRVASPFAGSPVRHAPRLRAVPADGAVELPDLRVVVLAAAVAVFGLLFGIRLVQGGPIAGAPAPELGIVPGATVGPTGGEVVTAQSGDTLWSIARTIRPEGDPRPVVAALIDANGGDAVQAGQQIVIPEELLD